MEFSVSPQAQQTVDILWDFMRQQVFPAEAVWQEQSLKVGPHTPPPVLEELKQKAKRRGLWNLFLPELGMLSNLDYAHIAEITGWSPVIAPEALNCQAPDTGNMELLCKFGTEEQQNRWLQPLLDGDVRSAFAMSEPDVASSDATNIATRIEVDGDDLVINGRKWFITGTGDERCRFMIVMGLSNPDNPRHRQHSLVIVPMDTPGVVVERQIPTFGYQTLQGHGEIVFRNARVPRENLIGDLGDGFTIAQNRLGPGRLHHSMRAIGMAERAHALMVDRAKSRVAFGSRLADFSNVQDSIAMSRIEIDQARLHVLHTAWLIDEKGTDAARSQIAALKVAIPAMAVRVIDRAIEVHGAAGVSDDTPLAWFLTWARLMKIMDGPDAVHRRTVARFELKREREWVG